MLLNGVEEMFVVTVIVLKRFQCFVYDAANVIAAYGSKVGPRLNPEDGSTSPHSSSSAHTSPTTRIRQRIRSADADSKKMVCSFYSLLLHKVLNVDQL